MFLFVKILIIEFLRTVLKVFYVVPIKKNRVLFISYNGTKYNDNPKLIFKELTDYGYPEYHANFLT